MVERVGGKGVATQDKECWRRGRLRMTERREANSWECSAGRVELEVFGWEAEVCNERWRQWEWKSSKGKYWNGECKSCG